MTSYLIEKHNMLSSLQFDIFCTNVGWYKYNNRLSFLRDKGGGLVALRRYMCRCSVPEFRRVVQFSKS